MKAIERHLYSRTGYFYFRTALPRNLHFILGFKEIRIALGTQDLSEARMQAVQLDYALSKHMKSFGQKLNALTPDQSPDPLIDTLAWQISTLKGGVTRKIPERFTQTHWKAKPVQQLLFSQLVEKYLEDCPADSHSTREHKESTYILFREVIGDVPFKRSALNMPARLSPVCSKSQPMPRGFGMSKALKTLTGTRFKQTNPSTHAQSTTAFLI